MTNTDAERVSDIVPVAYIDPKALRELTDQGKRQLLTASVSSHPLSPTYVALVPADIIEAQSKALAEAMVVKPLEWQRSNVADRWAAWHPWGEYEIIRDQRDQKYRSPQFNAAGAYWSDLDQVQREIGEAHEKRVMSILSASPQSNPGGI